MQTEKLINNYIIYKPNDSTIFVLNYTANCNYHLPWIQYTILTV